MNHSQEWRLLLACARTNIHGENLQRINKLVDADLDWDYVEKTSCSHGIAPLVYHSLHRSGVISLLPFAPAERLRSTYYGNAARNALLYDELRAVLTMLREQGSEVIVLKGAALAETVYPHRALRPMSDIDLLVRRERLAEIETKLLEMGYVPDERRKTREWFHAHHYHLGFVNSSGIPIEIHWHVARPNHRFSIDIDGFWERAQSNKIAGVEALVLSPEDLLLHICQHMHKHALIGGIRPLCDIAHAVEYYGNAINWMEFRSRSGQWGISPYVYLALYLAKELFEAHIPRFFLDDFEPADFDRAVIPWAKERVLDGESSLISQNLVQLCWEGRRFSDRLAALGSALAPQAVAQYYSVPKDLNRLPLYYYPRRIRYLFSRYGPLLWRLISGDHKTRLVYFEREDNQLRLTKWLSSGYQ